MGEPDGTLGPADLNRLVIHHLSAHGYGPKSMGALVARPGMLHFAAASAMSTPDYLAWAEATQQRCRPSAPLRRRARLRAARFALERPLRSATEAWMQRHPRPVRRVLAPALEPLVPRLGPALASVPEWQEHVLDRALEGQPRLLFSRAQEAFSGWVTVDPVTPLLSATSHAKFGAAAPAVVVRLDAQRALQSRRAGSLRSLVVLDTLEALPQSERATFLRACRRACRGEVRLTVAQPAIDAPPGERFAELVGRRHALTREALRALLDEAEVAADLRSTDAEDVWLDLGDHRLRPPRGHWLVTLPAVAG